MLATRIVSSSSSLPIGMIVFLPPLISRIAGEGSKLSLHAVPLDSRHFGSKLESGEADLALGAFPKAPRGLRRQRLYFSGYLSIARKDHSTFRPPCHCRQSKSRSIGTKDTTAILAIDGSDHCRSICSQNLVPNGDFQI
jgi:DNA-binding transcriptional LysR family regulator